MLFRSWLKNGNINSDSRTDFDDDAVRTGLMNMDITTPGFIKLPVCSPDRAFQTWYTGSKSENNYPCNIPRGMDRCGNSTIVGETTEASPSSSDCLQIIRNIEGDGHKEFVVGIGAHKTLEKHESCSFGVKVHQGDIGGAVMYKVGGQDIIDNINEALNQFGGGGKVGAMGIMSCGGTTAGTRVTVEWGLF